VDSQSEEAATFRSNGDFLASRLREHRDGKYQQALPRNISTKISGERKQGPGRAKKVAGKWEL
jgi:hypothetical protein